MDVRGQILQEATKRFASQGFDGTSIQEIAESVGIRKPSLLYHFPTKDDLRQSVLEGVFNHWNAVLPKLLLEAAREERFDSVMRSLCVFFLEDPNRARLFVREILDRPRDLREQLLTHVRPWIGIVASQLEGAKKNGLVRADVDAEAYALQVVILVVGGIAMLESLEMILPGDADRAAARERHVRELIRMARVSLYTQSDFAELRSSARAK